MLKNVVLSVVAFILTLTFGELVLRSLEIPKFYKAHSSPAQFRFLPTGPASFIYTNSPDTQICFTYDGNPRRYFNESNTVCHTTNKWGFRGVEFDTVKTENELRIGVLGDSFTFGEGVNDEDTYCHRLQNLLSKKFPDKKIRVLNFGIGGYNTVQEYELFTEFLAPLKVDVLVLAMTLNDAEPRLFYYNPADNSINRRGREQRIHEGLPDQTPQKSTVGWSHVYQMAWKIRNDERITRSTVNYYNSLYMDHSDSRIEQQAAIRKFKELAVSDSTPIVAMLFPVFYKLNEDYPFKEIHEKLRSDFGTLESPLLRFLDLQPAYSQFDGPDLWVHPTDQHPNEIAHGVAADMLAAEIEGILDQALPK